MADALYDDLLRSVEGDDYEVLLDHGAMVLEGLRLTDADALIDCIGQGVKRFRRLVGTRTISLFAGDLRGGTPAR